MTEPLPPDYEFRSMEPNDVRDVLAIIRGHDEDDAAHAKTTYGRSLDGHYVLTRNHRIIGCTGASDIPGTERSYWLSWTYLLPDYQGQGIGRSLLEQMLDVFREVEARKVFVTTSDYYDPRRGDIYQAAMEAYRAVGFAHELTHQNYYAPDESQIVLGLRLQPPASSGRVHEEMNLAPRLLDVDEIPETDDAYYVAWELTDEAGSAPDELERMIAQVRKWKGRAIFVGVPSDAPQVNHLFTAAGFRHDGRLMDFYEDGVDEAHYRLDL